MKKFLFLTFAWLVCGSAFAQETLAHQGEKGYHAVHTVVPKENFYSLGRLYNVSPKDIAAFNNIDMERGLTVGQTVNIPLTKANFTQEKATGHPVYYVVGEKEGLYRVSVNNNKVLMANLRKWNGLQSDAVSAGQKLIVGYLLTNEPPSTATKNTSAPEVRDYAEKPVEKADEPKPEPAKKEIERSLPANQPAGKKTEVRTVLPAANESAAGYFKPDFDAQIKAQPVSKSETATAGIFKTASGWQDAKYYALIDGVEPGTIIRVVNPANNQAIYAKVLDRMMGIRQNQGYNVRISNAAATALGITATEKFSVRVHY